MQIPKTIRNLEVIHITIKVIRITIIINLQFKKYNRSKIYYRRDTKKKKNLKKLNINNFLRKVHYLLIR